MRLRIRRLAKVACSNEAHSAHGIAHLPRFDCQRKLVLRHYTFIRQGGKHLAFVRLCTKVQECVRFPYLSCAPTNARETDALFGVFQKIDKSIGMRTAIKNKQKIVFLCGDTKLAHKLTSQQIDGFTITFGKR